MVSVYSKTKLRPLPWSTTARCRCLVTFFVLFAILALYRPFSTTPNSTVFTANDPLLRTTHQDTTTITTHSPNSDTTTCPYKSLSDLSASERHPRAGDRHVVDPPNSTTVTLVCCDTTKGPLSIAVHHSWAPFGAARFLDMVRTHYFSHRIPLMRCVAEFICQFGLAGAAVSQLFAKKIPDDPAWLPRDRGVRRFAKGYLAYAGSGPRSRGRQLFVALADNDELGGAKAPWEVPWGEVVGVHSFNTLTQLYTGYGEDGPSQELLLEEDALRIVEHEFPELDYILSCVVMDVAVDVAVDMAG